MLWSPGAPPVLPHVWECVCACYPSSHLPGHTGGARQAMPGLEFPAGEAAGGPCAPGAAWHHGSLLRSRAATPGGLSFLGTRLHKSLLLFVFVIVSTGNILRFFWSVAVCFSLSLQSKKIPVFGISLHFHSAVGFTEKCSVVIFCCGKAFSQRLSFHCFWRVFCSLVCCHIHHS